MKRVVDGARIAMGCIAAVILLVAEMLAPEVSFAQSVTAAPVTAASWVPAGDLGTPRYWHTATLLNDGRVLVAGGRVDDCCSQALSSAELFDAATRTFSFTGSMHVGRASHTATLLRDGRVLVVGTQAELYDPITGTWSITGNPASGGSTATLLSSGKVLVTGGSRPGAMPYAAADLYDPATGQWSATGSLIGARMGHTATLMRNGQVLIVGGVHPNGNIENPDEVTTAELYDENTGQWRLTTSPNRHYLSPASTLLANGNVLILGDVGDTEQYDPATATWTITGTRAAGPVGYAATPLHSGQILVAGGYDSKTVSFGANAELYDGNTGNWTDIAPLITARSRHTATTLADGSVLVVGGTHAPSGRDFVLGSAELYQTTDSSPVIGPGYTGAWYDPGQSGHGLLIEVLPDSRFNAAWFTFDPSGAQAWFTGVGTYSGNTATIDAVDQPTGGRWIPNFDPSRVVHNAWGRLTFTFSDCNHGRVDFDSVRGYGSGSMNLTRLTQPTGLTCQR